MGYQFGDLTKSILKNRVGGIASEPSSNNHLSINSNSPTAATSESINNDDKEDKMGEYRFGDLTKSILKNSLGSIVSEPSSSNQLLINSPVVINTTSESINNDDKEDENVDLSKLLTSEMKRKIGFYGKKETSITGGEMVDKEQQEMDNEDSLQNEENMVNGSSNINNCLWPDPTPSLSRNENLYVDDISRLNSTSVNRIFQCRNKQDVLYVLKLARQNRKTVSIRGTKHSMGGHSITQDGYVIDTLLLTSMEYNEEDKSVSVGPGVLWSDLIKYLNKFSRSPKTVQSYSNFSIGGALSVNAHGITTDFCMSESVIEFLVLLSDGREILCNRHSKDPESIELFRLCIGGYGMFGIIIDIKLKTVKNCKLILDSIQCHVKNFDTIHKTLRDKKCIEVKMARLDISTCNFVNIYIFRKENENQIESSMPCNPRTLSQTGQLLYKWLMTGLQGLRFTYEQQQGVATDIKNDSSERNLLMYESALPLAKLSSPFLEVDDTFILQEYFVPRNAFYNWMFNAENVILQKNEYVNLLNITIRFVQEDTDTFLRYSNNQNGMYAFVLYFRLPRHEDAEKELKTIHDSFVKHTLNCDGTFYLPYRHHYSEIEALASYPMLPEFFEKKKQYDPMGMFDSLWYQKYHNTGIDSHNQVVSFDKSNNREISNEITDRQPNNEPLFVTSTKPRKLNENLHDVDFKVQPSLSHLSQTETKENVGFNIKTVSEKRTDSYYQLFLNRKNNYLRSQFYDSFLKNIFNIEAPGKVQGLICNAIWNPSLGNTDDNIYSKIVQELEAQNSNLALVLKTYRGLSQLNAQKQELLQESEAIITRLGRFGKLCDYVSIGDHGKMCNMFRSALGLRGQSYIVHNEMSSEISAKLERGQIDSPGSFVYINYNNPNLKGLGNNCCDIITLNAGLHHFPQQGLAHFIQECARILRPGGLLILREHNGTEDLIPILDVAHSIFNAFTSVSITAESEEIRAFRPILEWREIFQNFGFDDSMLYCMEEGDPTKDEMMCFIKRGEFIEQTDADVIAIPKSQMCKPQPQLEFAKLVISKVPEIGTEILMEGLKNMLKGSKFIKIQIENLKENETKGKQFLIQEFLDNLYLPLNNILENILCIGEKSKLKTDNVLSKTFPEEIFLLGQILLDTENNDVEANPIVKALFLEMVDFFREDKKDNSEENDEMDEYYDTLNKKQNESTVDENTLGRIYEIVEQLFIHIPDMWNLQLFLKQSGLSSKAKLWLQSQVKDWSIQGIYGAIVPYIEVDKWDVIEKYLLQILRDPLQNKLNLSNVTNDKSLWWKVTMEFLESDLLKPTHVGLAGAKWIGLSKVVAMFHLAQENKLKNNKENDNTRCGENNNANKKSRFKFDEVTIDQLQKLLTKSQQQDNDEELETLQYSIMNILRTKCENKNKNRLLGGTNDKLNMEYNYYKLAEWLQVEIISLISSYAEHTPWYRFPFIEFLKIYFVVLKKSFFIVYKRFGLQKALFSDAFVTDFVPGIIMAAIFGQAQLLAYPIKMVLGEEDTTEEQIAQLEHIIIVTDTNYTDISIEPEPRWWTSESIQPGLHILKVPYMKPFSNLLVKLAQTPEVLYVLEISGKKKIQLKINAKTAAQLKLLTNENENFKVLFSYQFPCNSHARQPTVDNRIQGSGTPVISFSLEVNIIRLLIVLRLLLKNKVEIVQIFDYYG